MAIPRGLRKVADVLVPSWFPEEPDPANVVTVNLAGGGTYYLRFKLVMPERAGTHISTFTATNNSVATTTALTAQSTG